MGKVDFQNYFNPNKKSGSVVWSIQLKKGSVLVGVLTILVCEVMYAASIRQIVLDKNYVVIQIEEDSIVKVGDTFFATNKGKQCPLEVTTIKESFAFARINNCPFKNDLEVGQKVEAAIFSSEEESQHSKNAEDSVMPTPSPILVTPPPSSEVEEQSVGKNKRSYSSLFIGPFYGTKIRMAGTAFSSTASEKGAIEYSTKTNVYFGFEWSEFKRFSWNNGLEFSFNHIILDTVTISSSFGSSNGIISGEIGFYNFSYSGKYMWEQIYLPVGIGLTAVKYSEDIPILKATKGSLISWLGIGVNVNPFLSLEFQSRVQMLRVDEVSSGTVRIIVDTASVTGAGVVAKFLF